MIRFAFVLIVFCAIAETQSEGYGRPYGPMQYNRMKRLKYSSAPQRYYGRPPGTSPNEPPPRYPGSSRPKVSKRPTNEGLDEQDLQNFVKYLSKQDLDKILELAGHKTKDPYENQLDYRPTTDKYKSVYNSIQDQENYSPKAEDESKIFSSLVQEIDLDPKYNPYQNNKPSEQYQNEAYVSDRSYQNLNDYEQKMPKNEYNNFANYVTEPTPLSAFYSDPQNINIPLDTQESRNQIFSNIPNNGVLITDSKVMPEENLPRPVNLRDDQDTDVSYTNNMPTVVIAEPSYKVESFAELPLMDYHSKLDTVSSYHVPHYIVTSSKSQTSAAPSSYAVPPPSSYTSSYSPSSSKIPVEPAPPSSAAKEQSDAHLKAVRIWSHMSKGTAYILHDDGSLSLEKPGKPKTSYGYP